MSCFSCMSLKKAKRIEAGNCIPPIIRFSSDISGSKMAKEFGGGKDESEVSSLLKGDVGKGACSFTFRELSTATKDFSESKLLGEGGFGKVYKGCLEDGQTVAVKQLNHDGCQGHQEFLVEVVMLSHLHHPNLVTLIGYCTDGDQRLLVYEYMPMGSLEDHLFDLAADQEPLEWNTRMKIAVGTARGMQYLHCKADPPVIYRDLKSANILLDNDFNTKLSDFGLAKLGPVGDETHVSTRVMGTYGYCAPEYAMSGHLTVKSDIFSFGVVLLELITGRKAYDSAKQPGERSLFSWSLPLIREPRNFSQYVDPLLNRRFPPRCLYHLVAIAAMCVQEQPSFRPQISEIVVALEYLAAQAYKADFHRGMVRSPSQGSAVRRDGDMFVRKPDPGLVTRSI